jgi:hypothetical protein
MNRTVDLRLHSLKFVNAPGRNGEQIRLADPDMDKWLDKVQWVRDGRSLPVAFVRGQRPFLQVELEVESFFAFPKFELSAYGSFHDPGPGRVTSGRPLLGPYLVRLDFPLRTNRFVKTSPIRFNAPLPNVIGRHLLRLDWYADRVERKDKSHRRKDKPRQRLFVGHSELTVCTTWKRMVVQPENHLDQWAYAPVMEWSCDWAHGAKSPEQICRQLMKRLPASGLQYGFPAWGIRTMLATGGGMCGGWQELFAQLANCQGVALSPQTMMLPAAASDPWTHLVVKDGGMNQFQSSFFAGQMGHYRDSNRRKPVTERRYRFEQDPNGHSVNMLALPRNRVAIYDASYWHWTKPLKMRVPKFEGERITYGPRSTFRRGYFDQAMYALTRRATAKPVDSLDFGHNIITSAIEDPITLVWNRAPDHPSLVIEKIERVLERYFEESNRILKLLGEWRPTPSRRHVAAALRQAGRLKPRPDAPIPHNMPPVELLQYLLLQLAGAPPRPRPELSATSGARPQMMMEPGQPVAKARRSRIAAPDEVRRLSTDAESHMLRRLAMQLLTAEGGGGRSQGRRRKIPR